MTKGDIAYLDTDKDTHFTGALTQNSMELESISFPWNGIQECILEGLSVQSDQQLEWDVILFSKSSAEDTDLDVDTFIDFYNFPATAGKQIASANQYYYSIPVNVMAIPYRDGSNSGKLHVGLINRSATAKNAGATGEIKIRFILRPVYA